MGRIRLTGATSGYTELKAASTAGNNTITLPTTNGGEVVVSDSSGNVNIDSGTFYVDATNNRVGVGSNAPSYLLDLLGSAPRIRVKDSSTGAAFHHFENNSGNFYLGIDNSTGGSLSAGNYARVLWSQGAYPLVFATNDTQRAQIDSSGRLLVGTNTARTAVFFNGDANSNPLTQIEQSGVGGASAGAALSVVRNTTTPGGGAYIVLAKSAGSSNGSVSALSNGDVVGLLTFQAADGTDFVECAQIKSEVDGTPGANDMPGRLVFSTTADGASSPTERMRLASNGDLTCPGVYSNTTAAAANVVVSTSPYYILRSTSSIKYKTNVEDIDPAYSAKLLDCRPVWFRSTCSIDNPNWSHWGFIAEEVASIDPRLVHWKTKDRITQEDGTQVEIELDTPEPEGVQYDRFVPHLLNLIKRQGEAIADLQTEVAALKAQPS